MKQMYRLFFIFAVITALVSGTQFMYAQDTTYLPIDTCLSMYIYEWHDNQGASHDTTLSESGIHYIKIDSTRTDTIELQLNPRKGTDVRIACDSLEWHGSWYYNSTNTPTDTIFNVGETGCDSVVTLHLTIIKSVQKVKDIVCKRDTADKPYMLVYPDAGYQYQWYKNDVLIDGATKQYYAPEGVSLNDTNKYKVEVCVSKLDKYCCKLSNEWHDTHKRSSKIRILPNPNNGQFRLMLPEDAVNVQIFNANGQVVMTRKTDGNELLDMSTGLTNGLYFVKTFLKDGSCNTEKLIINR